MAPAPLVRIKTIVAIALALAACSGGTWLLTRGAAPAGPARATEPGRASASARVSGVRVAVRPVRETLMLTGSVLARESVALRPEVSGKVTGLFFEEGADVSQGSVLVQLNDDELRASLDRARHRHRIALDRESRLGRLVVDSGISEEEYDRSRHEQGAAQAEIALIEAQLAKTRIVAPYDGVIGLRGVSLGSLVGTSDVVAQLQVLDQVKVEFTVPERHRAALTVGLVVRFRVAGRADWVEASIYAIEPAVDVATRSVRVRALAANPHRHFAPGAFAEVELPLRDEPEGMLVPTIAVLAQAQSSLVYVDEAGRAQPRPVRTGMRFADDIAVLEGLAPGEVVITSGLSRLRAGMPVQVEIAR